MKVTKGFSPVIRAVGVFSAVAVIVGGATYAAFTDTVTLAENSASSPDASLLISNGATDWGKTAPGFAFTDLVPGTFTAPKKFYLNNSGTSDLTVTAHVPTAPTSSDGYGFEGWENLEVKFTSLNPECTGADSVKTTDMAALLAGDVALPCNPLSAGKVGSNNTSDDEGDYSVAFNVKPASVKGNDIDIDSINFDFKGSILPATSTPPVTPTVH